MTCALVSKLRPSPSTSPRCSACPRRCSLGYLDLPPTSRHCIAPLLHSHTSFHTYTPSSYLILQSRHQKLVFRTNMYKLREEREISARVFGNLVATTLYEKRFGPYFSEPVIAGIPPIPSPISSHPTHILHLPIIHCSRYLSFFFFLLL